MLRHMYYFLPPPDNLGRGGVGEIGRERGEMNKMQMKEVSVAFYSSSSESSHTCTLSHVYTHTHTHIVHIYHSSLHQYILTRTGQTNHAGAPGVGVLHGLNNQTRAWHKGYTYFCVHVCSCEWVFALLSYCPSMVSRLEDGCYGRGRCRL